MRNVTEDVKKIVKFVQENCEKVGSRFGRTAQQNRLTLNMLVDVFVGKVHFGWGFILHDVLICWHSM